MTFDPNKPYRCRGGYEAIIDEIDACYAYPIQGRWKDNKGLWHRELWLLDGRVYESVNALENLDLVNIEEEKPMRKLIEMGKPCKTAGGLNVRVLCTDIKRSPWPVVGIVTESDGSEYVVTWTADGREHKDKDDKSIRDIQPVPEELVRYAVVLKESVGPSHCVYGDHLYFAEKEAQLPATQFNGVVKKIVLTNLDESDV